MIRWNGYQKFAGMKGRKSALKPFPRAEADDESKNWYLAKLTRVQCRLRMQKMVELLGLLGVGRRVRTTKKKSQGYAKVRVEKGKEDGRREREKSAV